MSHPIGISPSPARAHRGARLRLLCLFFACLAPAAALAEEAPAPESAKLPLLREVHLEGNEAISDDDLIGVLPLRRGEPLTPELAQKAAEAVFAVYAEKGYAKARVQWRGRDSTGQRVEEDKSLMGLANKALSWLISPAGRKAQASLEDYDTVDLFLFIDEGKQVDVEELRLVGNGQVSTDDLEGILRTKESVPLADLLGWGVFRESALAADVAGIETLYLNRGFLDVKVGPPDIKLSADNERVRIKIPIREGRLYRLGRVEVKGDLVVDQGGGERGDEVTFDRSVLLSRLGVRGGEVASRSALTQGLQRVAKKLHDYGYAYANITPTTKKRGDSQIVDVEITIDAGPRVRVERVEILGNDKTRDHVIRREMRTYEGEWFSADRLKRSEARVAALGFFSKVNVTMDQGSKLDRMVITVEVEEKNTGLFQLGAGFGAEGFLFNGQVAYANFLGMGQRAAISAQLSGARRLFDLQVADPFFLEFGDHPLAASIRAYSSDLTFGDFNRSSSGLDLTLAYPIGRPFSGLTDPLTEDAPDWARPFLPDLENLHLFVSADAERVLIDTPYAGLLPGIDNTLPRYTTSLEAGLIWDQRDNRILPTNGYLLRGAIEVANPLFGAGLMPGAERELHKTLLRAGMSDVANALSPNALANDFQRFTLNGRFYFSFDQLLPIRGIVAKANVELGYLRSESDLPFESYYLGGIDSMRGYPLRSISPVSMVRGDDGRELGLQTGGNKQLNTNLELEFPVVEALGIRGVLFFDAGNVYGRGENLFYLGQRPGGGEGFDAVRDLPLGLYSSVGFGVRWFSPIGPLRFEWGLPLSRRPSGTPGLRRGDEPILFQFSIGNSF